MFSIFKKNDQKKRTATPVPPKQGMLIVQMFIFLKDLKHVFKKPVAFCNININFTNVYKCFPTNFEFLKFSFSNLLNKIYIKKDSCFS